MTAALVYNPFDPAEIADPYPTYSRLVTESPVLPQPLFSGYVLARWVDVRRVLVDRQLSADRERSSFLRTLRASGSDLPQPDDSLGPSLLTLDPPDHTRLRRLVSSAFTPRRVEGLRARIEAIVDQLLQQIGTHDFMEDFAYPLPVIVIAELLGLPPSDRGDLKRWSDDVALLLDPFPPAEAIDAYRHSIMEFNAYAVTQFEARRRSPRDDLLSALVRARDGEDALSDVELFSMLVLLVAAGHETTTNLLGNAVIALTQRPDQVPRLLEDPVNGVEELLRFDSPVQRTSRVVLEPFPLGEFEAAPGDLLFLVLGAANRDPDHFPDPGRLDLTRANAGEHLSFGHGVHHCLGAPLARLEAQIALPRLYSRHPGLAADLDRIEWRPSIVLRGPKRLPITL